MKLVQKIAIATICGAGILGAATTAQAGRGGSPSAIQNAIAANSVDSIQAELERAEYLVCAACTDMVVPLIDHLDYRVRKVAAWWLVRRASSRQIYVSMLSRLSQPDSVKARNAADVLGEFGYPSAVPALGAALSNPVFSGEARAAMARALGAINQPTVTQPLVDALSASDPLVQAAAVTALRNVSGFHDASVAVPLMGAADQQVRAEAMTTVGMLRGVQGNAGVVPGLVTALSTDPSEVVRKRAAWALGQVGAPSSVAAPALQTAASSDASPFVRSLARAALTKLTH